MSVSFTSTQKGAITSSRTLTDDQIQELANKATPLFVEYFQQPSYESLGREIYKNRLKEIVAPHTSPQRISSAVDVIFRFMEKSKEPNPININHRLNFAFKNPSLPPLILIIDNSFRLVEEQTFKMLEPNIDKTEQAKLAKVIENHLAGIKCSVENPAIHTENLNEEDKQKLPSACSALISLSSALDFQHHYRSLLDTKIEISFEGIKSHSNKQPMEVIKPPLHFLDPQIPEFVMKKIERFGILPILQPFFSKISSAHEGSIRREMTRLESGVHFLSDLQERIPQNNSLDQFIEMLNTLISLEPLFHCHPHWIAIKSQIHDRLAEIINQQLIHVESMQTSSPESSQTLHLREDLEKNIEFHQSLSQDYKYLIASYNHATDASNRPSLRSESFQNLCKFKEFALLKDSEIIKKINSCTSHSDIRNLFSRENEISRSFDSLRSSPHYLGTLGHNAPRRRYSSIHIRSDWAIKKAVLICKTFISKIFNSAEGIFFTMEEELQKQILFTFQDVLHFVVAYEKMMHLFYFDHPSDAEQKGIPCFLKIHSIQERSNDDLPSLFSKLSLRPESSNSQETNSSSSQNSRKRTSRSESLESHGIGEAIFDVHEKMTDLNPKVEGMNPDLLSAIRCYSPTQNVPNFKEYLLPSLPLSHIPPESFSPMIIWEEASMPVNFSNERRYWQCRIKTDSEEASRKKVKTSFSEKDEVQ